MSPTWLDQLEQNLEERLDAFLHSNPDQDRLLQEQHLQDRQRDLSSRRDLMQIQARDLRGQLLSLAEQVQAWGERTRKARNAGADDLALRAEKHVQTLMDQAEISGMSWMSWVGTSEIWINRFPVSIRRLHNNKDIAAWMRTGPCLKPNKS